MAERQKILIVDDRKENLLALRMLFRGLDAEVVEATSGKQALALSLNHRFAVAIVDVMMPGMNGYELAEHLGGDDNTRLMPIIFVTASYEAEGQQFRAYEAGCIDYIVKPFQPEVLIGKVRIFLELSRARDDLRSHRDHLETLVAERTRDLQRANEIQRLEIIERTRLGKKLRASEAKLRSIVDNIGIGICLIRPDMRILEFNRQMQTWYPEVALAEQPLCYRVLNAPLQDQVCPDCPAHATLRDARVHEITAHLSKPEGTRSYRIVASPVLDETGTVVSVIEMIDDVTDRLSLERQLLQSQKLEAVGQLAGGVAHDFNNMLSIIIGYGEQVMERLHESDPLREPVKEIVHAGNRSAALTRQLLAFSRKQTLQVVTLNVNHIIRNMEKMMGRLIGENIALKTSLAKESVRIKADPHQLEQVIMNLVVNARDAMPKGGTLTIETRDAQSDDPLAFADKSSLTGKCLRLSISDTGCGMDAATREKIFEPFFTTKEMGRGSGLGLSTVYGIVEQLGGRIAVESEPGRGTVFNIYLPQTQVMPVAQEKPSELKNIGAGQLGILLVEDEQTLRKLIQRMLQDLGFNVTAVANGDEALNLFQKEAMHPDLLITDMVMPGMSGSDLADQLRKFQPELGLLYMSGYTDTTILRHGVLDPDIPFLRKPFSKRDLSEKLTMLLNKNEMRKRSSGAHPGISSADRAG